MIDTPESIIGIINAANAGIKAAQIVKNKAEAEASRVFYESIKPHKAELEALAEKYRPVIEDLMKERKIGPKDKYGDLIEPTTIDFNVNGALICWEDNRDSRDNWYREYSWEQIINLTIDQ